MTEYIEDFDNEEEDNDEPIMDKVKKKYHSSHSNNYDHIDYTEIKKHFDRFVKEKVNLEKLEVRKRNGQITRRDRLVIMVAYLEWSIENPMAEKRGRSKKDVKETKMYQNALEYSKINGCSIEQAIIILNQKRAKYYKDFYKKNGERIRTEKRNKYKKDNENA